MLVGLLCITSCTDECETTHTYKTYTPIYRQVEELRNSIQFEEARDLKLPGKIYFKGQYIFINEFQEGVHIINNSNPVSPQNIGFINIPGNVDIAIKDNALYADSYMDLVTLDITDLNQIKEVARVENIFDNFYAFNVDQDQIVVDWEESWESHSFGENCNNNDDVFIEPIFFRGELTTTDASFAQASTAMLLLQVQV